MHFHEWFSLYGRYFHNIYVVQMFEIVCSSNVKDNNIFPCLHNIRLSYNMQKCFSVLPIRVRMSTSNSKHGSFLW